MFFSSAVFGEKSRYCCSFGVVVVRVVVVRRRRGPRRGPRRRGPATSSSLSCKNLTFCDICVITELQMFT